MHHVFIEDLDPWIQRHEDRLRDLCPDGYSDIQNWSQSDSDVDF